MDKVIIKNLLARGIIGIRDWERKRAQDILINIILFTDTHRAAQSDDINDCADYSTITKKVQVHAESAGRFTVEALANDLAKLCLDISDSKVGVDVIKYPDSYPDDEPNRRCPNIEKAKNALSFKPQVDLNLGLSRFFEWTKQNYTDAIL